MTPDEAHRALHVVRDEAPRPAHESSEWLALLRSPPSTQVEAMQARGLGRTAVLFVQNACESHCFFCANPGVLAPRPDEITSAPEIDSWIEAASGVAIGRVCIAGNEPARHPHLPRALLALRDRVHAPIEVMTSGLALGEVGTAARWYDSGVRAVAVPLYSVEAAAHDAVVGRTGAHALSVAGLDAARAAGIE
jgi:molybdenum cofactor biosynthesis enzyme MoaA